MEGNAVRTMEKRSEAESESEPFVVFEQLIALAGLFHSNWTRSPPLADKAVKELGEIISRASSQLLPASMSSEI